MYRGLFAVLFLVYMFSPLSAAAQQNCDPDFLAELLQLEDMNESPVGKAAALLDDPTMSELSTAYRELSEHRIEIEESWDEIVDCSDSHRDLVINYLHLVGAVEDLLVLKILEVNGVISNEIYRERARPIGERVTEKLEGIMQYLTVED